MTGTLINVVAVLAGGLLGLFLGTRLPEKLKQTVMAGLGLFTMAIGLQMFLKTQNSLVVLGAVLVGGVLGEWWRIEDGLENLGVFLEKRFMGGTGSAGSDGSNSRFVRGFLTASLVFCVGPMAILGSIQDGLSGDSSLLVIKSVLDCFAALAFASSLGVGVMFSALVVLFYQGGISLLAVQAQAVVNPAMMNEMTAAGGLILMGIAFSGLLGIKKIRTGSFLPALVIAPILAYFFIK